LNWNNVFMAGTFLANFSFGDEIQTET
jgi:hypothetical protein